MNRIWIIIVILYAAFGVWFATEWPRQCIPAGYVPNDAGKIEREPAVFKRERQVSVRVPTTMKGQE